MITSWKEINYRYNAIKDHKPRATKKLKELGEILASAYKLDPNRADQMWQYIIELNIRDNITFSKFYVSQVFNKLAVILTFDEAVEYVSMNPERVQLMLLYGSGGLTFQCYGQVIGEQLINNQVDAAIDIVAVLQDGLKMNESSNIFSVCSKFNTLCVTMELYENDIYICYDIPKANLISFLVACVQNFGDNYIRTIAVARLVILSGKPITNKGKAIQIIRDLLEITCLDNRSFYNPRSLNRVFFLFLYYEKEIIGYEAEDIIYNYCENVADLHIPIPLYHTDETCVASTWFRGIASDSSRIIKLLFEKMSCNYYYLKDQLEKCIYDNDWKNFIQYLTLGLSQERECASESYLDFVKEKIQTYLLKDTISQPCVTKDNVNDFIHAIATVCLLTSDSKINEQFIDMVRSFVSKEKGNVDALKSVGLQIEVDYRTELEKFCEYAKKESVCRSEYNNDYFHQPAEFYRNIQQETKTYGIETGKLLAKKPEILSFLFLHDAHSCSVKTDIILGAILSGDFNIVFKCMDYMLETAKYPNFSDWNSWSMEIKNVVVGLLKEVFEKQDFCYEGKYEENVTATVIHIAEKFLLYLSADDVWEVKAELLKVNPSDASMNEFTDHLMKAVSVYTAKKKPNGYTDIRKNSITMEDRITRTIFEGIRNMAEMNRLDIIAYILRELIDGRQDFDYKAWMTGTTNLTEKQAIELYYLIPEVYSKYIEVSDRRRALELLVMFGKVGNQSIYNTLQNQIMQKHGYIEGMFSCYPHSEETEQPILLVENQYVEISWLYWNASAVVVRNQLNITGVEIVLCIRNKYNDFVSLYGSQITVNGIALSELMEQKEFGDLVRAKYSAKSGSEETYEIQMVWGNNQKLRVGEISKIVFSIVIQKDNIELMTMGPFTIKYDLIQKKYEFF